MKAFLFMWVLVIGFCLKAEESLWSEFSMQAYPSLGVGSQLMDSQKTVYGTVKVFPLQYGPKDIGMSFFGLGYSVSKFTGSPSFSLLGLRAKNTLVTVDIHYNRSDQAGLSFNYYWP